MATFGKSSDDEGDVKGNLRKEIFFLINLFFFNIAFHEICKTRQKANPGGLWLKKGKCSKMFYSGCLQE